MPSHTLGSAGVDQGWVCTCGWRPSLDGTPLGEQWQAHLADEGSDRLILPLRHLKATVIALVSVLAVVDAEDHADTCAASLSPGAGYPCGCWKAEIHAAISAHIDLGGLRHLRIMLRAIERREAQR